MKSKPVRAQPGNLVGTTLSMAAVTFLLVPSVAVGEDLFFSASAYAVGAGGSEFVHEVEVLNPSGVPASFELAWLPRGEDNSDPLTVELTVDPGRATRFENILNEAFGLDPSVIGALELRSASDELVFHSLVLNVSNGNTIGQVIPPAPESSAFAGAESAFILGLKEDDDFRSNIWCVNTTQETVLVNALLFGIDGDQLDVIPLSIPPMSNVQYNRIFQNYAPVEGYVEVWTPTVGGRAICDGVVVGNLSNDPGTELGAKGLTAASTFYLPYAVESATQSSTLDLFAPSGDALVRIELLPSGTDNTTPDFLDIFIPAGQVGRLDHVLAAFAHQGTAALRLSAPGSFLMASSRTLDASPSGPLSRWVPSLPAHSGFSRFEVAALIHLRENPDFRTDIGFVNTSLEPLDLELVLHGEDGGVLGSAPVQLPPYGHVQLDGVFSSVGHPSVPVGFATVTTSTQGGSFLAYATVTNLNTQDSYHVTGERIRQAIFTDGFESGDTTAWFATVP